MRLADICEINPKAEELDDNTLVSFVAMSDISENGKINADTYRPLYEVKKGFSFFKEGDVLFAKITPCMENGKGALAVGLKNGIGFGSTEFHVLRPDTRRVVRKWLYYLTSWSVFRIDAERHMTGSAGQKRVPKAYLEKYELYVPPVDIQNLQIYILDRIQRIIEFHQKQLAYFDTLIKARFVEVFGNVQNEEKLVNLCTFIDYRGKTPKKTESGLPFITAKNVKMHHMSFDTQEFISKETYDKVMTRGFPKVGDVVFTTEAPLGNVCRIPFIETEFYIGQRIITMQTEKLVPAYLEYALSSDEFRKKIDEKSSGSTVTGIRSKLLEQLTIPVPSLTMQKQFSEFVERVDKSKVAVQNALDQAQLLFDSLMQEYFG